MAHSIAPLIIASMFFLVLIMALVILHILAIIGFGEGTPFTANASQRFYKGDLSYFALALSAALAGGMIYVQIT